MKKEKFFATQKKDISRAAVDFFSIGHIMMGQLFFWISYMLFTWPGGPEFFNITLERWDILFSVIVGIAWEPLENVVLFKMGFKFEGKLDSWLNAIFDILFWTLGAFLASLIGIPWLNVTLVIVEFFAWFFIRRHFLNLPV